MISLDEWIETLVYAQNMSRVRRRGFCYRSENMEMAQFIADKIGVDIEEFFTMVYEDSRKGDY